MPIPLHDDAAETPSNSRRKALIAHYGDMENIAEILRHSHDGVDRLLVFATKKKRKWTRKRGEPTVDAAR